MENTDSSLIEEMEDEKIVSKKKEILEELIKTVPYSLSVALIKITQLNNYAPLPLEKYYVNILPAFDLLRRTDGSKYKTHSKTTVRSAMVSNKLYTRNSEGLYEINLTNAIKHLQMIKQKKSVNENDFDSTYLDSNNNPYERNMNENMEPPQYDDDYNFMNGLDKMEKVKKSKKDKNIIKASKEFIGKKRKYTKKNRREIIKNKIEKYVKTFALLDKLLSISERDNFLNSQLTFNFADIGDGMNLNEKDVNIDKIIGMLTVFKYFKSFLEKCFNAIRIQDSLRNRINELNSEANYIEAIFRSEE